MERVVEKPSSHKQMQLAPEWRPQPDLVPMDGTDLSQGGGILLENGLPSKFVRGPFWRGMRDDPTVRTNDVKDIHLASREPDYRDISTGAELELLVWNPEASELYPVMDPGSPVVTKLERHNSENSVFTHIEDFLDERPTTLNFSDELLRQCIEVNFRHDTDGRRRGLIQLRALKKLAEVVSQQGLRLLPIAALPHRPMDQSDVSANPYVRRIALDHMGWERVRHYVGCSYQTHVEMFDPEVGLRSINYLQQVTPLLLGISASGPFVNGHVYLNQDDLPGMDNKRALWQSVRYLGRKWGSPSGGVIEFPAPDSIDEYLRIANQRLQTQDIPTVARGLGHHTDFRLRLDIGPWGTIELATPDTFGAHPVKLAAFSEFMKALTLKIQDRIREGRETDLPADLFARLDMRRLQIIEQDTIAVSKFGVDAIIHTAAGDSTSARVQFMALLNWVAQPDPKVNYEGLPGGIIDELSKSALTVPEAVFNHYAVNGVTSLIGFYESGVGTLSQWLHRKALELLQHGLSEREAITTCMSELGSAYHSYLSGVSVDEAMHSLFQKR